MNMKAYMWALILTGASLALFSLYPSITLIPFTERLCLGIFMILYMKFFYDYFNKEKEGKNGNC